MARGKWRTVVSLLGWGVFVPVLFFVVRALVRQLAAVPWSQVDFAPHFVALAMGCALASAALYVVSYRLLLGMFVPPPAWLAILPIAWLPTLGKYLPGKGASFAGAVWLLRHYNIPTAVAVKVVFMLHGLGVVIGLIMAAPLGLSRSIGIGIPAAWLCCLGGAAGVAVCFRVVLLRPLNHLLVMRFGRQPLPMMTRTRHWWGAIMIISIQWLCYGLALWFMARSVTDLELGELARFVSVSALAMTVGFLAIFAPAGLGVREGIFLVVLEPVVGAAHAAIIVVAMRLAQTIVEIVVGVIGFVILASLRKAPA